MGSVKAIFAYLLFALLAAAFFLVLLFPEQAVKAYIDGRLTAIDPSLTMTAETIRPATLPPGLKMTGIDFIRDGIRLVHFNDARVSPDLMTLLGDSKQARFQARLADGTINGRAVIQGTGPSERVRVEADLSQIRIEQLDRVKTNDRFTLSGTLGGHMKLDGNRSPKGGSSGSLTASELRITLKAPFFGIAELVMGQADATFSVNRQNLRLQSLTFDGPMAEGKISGTIMLKRPLGQSRLNLTGNVKPRPELFARLQETIPKGFLNPRALGTRGLNFRVRGSIDDPDVSMR